MEAYQPFRSPLLQLTPNPIDRIIFSAHTTCTLLIQIEQLLHWSDGPRMRRSPTPLLIQQLRVLEGVRHIEHIDRIEFMELVEVKSVGRNCPELEVGFHVLCWVCQGQFLLVVSELVE